MATLFTDEAMLKHVPAAKHPERPERLRAILRHLDRTGIRPSWKAGKSRTATREELKRVHSEGHLDRVPKFERTGGGLIEADTWVFPGSDEAALTAAGLAIEAVDLVASGKDDVAACLVRPPGHHARPDEPMGFCVYANVAAAAAHAVEALGLDRVLIVDFDVHHGNGTQEIFYEDPRVSFFSIHRHPFYPGTGMKDETGTRKGLGFTKNLPIAFGTDPADFHSAFNAEVSKFADKVRPQLLILSAGFDAHAEDPVGSLGLEVEDFERITEEMANLAGAHCDGRIVSVLEGGYNVPILAGCVASHLEILSKSRSRPT